MKLGSLTKLAASVLLSAGLFSNFASANLLPIVGQFDFSGNVTDNGLPVGNLVGATTLTITGAYYLGTSTGTYAAAGFPLFDSVSVLSPISLVPTQATPFALWSITAGVGDPVYSFEATSISEVTTGSYPGSQSLSIAGSGLASITGGLYATTTGTWSISITDTAGQLTDSFSFASDNAVAPIATPDGGSTAMLIALGLAGIAIGLFSQRRGLAKV